MHPKDPQRGAYYPYSIQTQTNYTCNILAIKQMCSQLSDVVLRNHFPLIQPVRHVVVGLKALQNLHEVGLTAPRKQRTFRTRGRRVNTDWQSA